MRHVHLQVTGFARDPGDGRPLRVGAAPREGEPAGEHGTGREHHRRPGHTVGVDRHERERRIAAGTGRVGARIDRQCRYQIAPFGKRDRGQIAVLGAAGDGAQGGDARGVLGSRRGDRSAVAAVAPRDEPHVAHLRRRARVHGERGARPAAAAPERPGETRRRAVRLHAQRLGIERSQVGVEAEERRHRRGLAPRRRGQRRVLRRQATRGGIGEQRVAIARRHQLHVSLAGDVERHLGLARRRRRQLASRLRLPRHRHGYRRCGGSRVRRQRRRQSLQVHAPRRSPPLARLVPQDRRRPVGTGFERDQRRASGGGRHRPHRRRRLALRIHACRRHERIGLTEIGPGEHVAAAGADHVDVAAHLGLRRQHHGRAFRVRRPVETEESEAPAAALADRDDERDAHAVVGGDRLPGPHVARDAARAPVQLAIGVERGGEQVRLSAPRFLGPDAGGARGRGLHVEPHHVVGRARQLGERRAQLPVVADADRVDGLAPLGERGESGRVTSGGPARGAGRADRQVGRVFARGHELDRFGGGHPHRVDGHGEERARTVVGRAEVGHHAALVVDGIPGGAGTRRAGEKRPHRVRIQAREQVRLDGARLRLLLRRVPEPEVLLVVAGRRQRPTMVHAPRQHRHQQAGHDAPAGHAAAVLQPAPPSVG